MDTPAFSSLMNRIGPVLNSLGIYMEYREGPYGVYDFTERLRYVTTLAQEGEIDGARRIAQERFIPSDDDGVR